MITAEMTDAEAFAKFFKRIQPEDYQRRAGDDVEAHLMFDAGDSISTALREKGFSPR